VASEERPVRPWTLVALAVVVAILLLLSLSVGWFGRDDKEALLRAAAAIAGFALLVGVTSLRVLRRTAAFRDGNGKRADPPLQPDTLWLFERQRQIAEVLRERGVEFAKYIPAFVELLIDPAKHRARTVETISLEGRMIRQRVAIEYSLPKPGTPAVYLPILRPLKGELVDNFSLFDSDGSSLADLTYEETVEIVSVALRLLIQAYLRERGARFGRQANNAETALLEIVSRRGKVDAAKVEEDLTKAVGMLPGNRVDSENARRLKKFVSALGTAYPIVAIVPVERGAEAERILVRYERTIISKPAAMRFKSQLRLFLGLRPYQINIPVDLALLSRSYHLQVEGPSDQYLMEQSLQCHYCKKRVSTGWRADPPSSARTVGRNCNHQDSGAHHPDWYFRLRRRRGQGYAHLYMRGYSLSGLQDLDLLIGFGETPPGTLASAVVTSMAVVVLIGLVGVISPAGDTPASDIPALVLAFPVIAASWFGFVSDSESILRTSLAARLSLINSGLLSFGAAALYLFQNHASKVSAQSGWSVLGLRDPLWGVLLFLALTSLLYVGHEFIVRSAYYNALLQRSDPETRYSTGPFVGGQG